MSIVAFFDLDYTLLKTSSGLQYIRESLKQRRVPWWTAAQVGLQYQLKLLDFGQAHSLLIRQVGRRGQAETAEFFRQWVPQRLFPRLAPAGRSKIEWHRQQGHRVVILSASIEEIVKPVAEHLGLHPRTLQRRLQDEGQVYGDIQTRSRYEHAVTQLKVGQVDIDTLSETLGFTDRNSFTRAFKQWTGMAPRDFRRLHRCMASPGASLGEPMAELG